MGRQGTVPIKPRGMHERTYQRILGSLPTTRPCESGGRVTLENTGPISIVPICGGNAEIDLLASVVGRFVDEARSGKARMETAARNFR